MFSEKISFFLIVDLAGVIVFAISGILTAGKKGMDLFGIIVISIVTAIGGGTIRDLLLNRFPIFWMSNPGYLIIIIITAILSVSYLKKYKIPFKALLIADALGLAFFTITGTKIAYQSGQHFLVSIIMGTITGVAGGMVRDILSAEIPLILRRDIYATASIVGAILYISIVNFVPENIAMVVGVISIFSLRMLAIIFKLKLPIIHIEH